jgi:hypothetical protein
LPQTAFGTNSFALQAGVGIGRRIQQGWCVRFEGDYLRSQLYAAGQNSFQSVIAVNYRF